MKHFKSVIIIFLLSAVCLQNCRKKDSTPCTGTAYYHNLNEQEKATVPYSGSDRLVFVSNAKDTAVCISQGKKQFFRTDVIPNSTNNACSPPSSDNYEAINYKMLSNKPQFSIDLNIYENDGFGVETIHIQYNSLPDFILYVSQIGYDKAVNFIDSIQVQKKWYRDVSVSYQYFNPALAKLYYNKEHGILKIQNADSTEIWELIK